MDDRARLAALFGIEGPIDEVALEEQVRKMNEKLDEMRRTLMLEPKNPWDKWVQ